MHHECIKMHTNIYECTPDLHIVEVVVEIFSFIPCWLRLSALLRLDVTASSGFLRAANTFFPCKRSKLCLQVNLSNNVRDSQDVRADPTVPGALARAEQLGRVEAAWYHMLLSCPNPKEALC